MKTEFIKTYHGRWSRNLVEKDTQTLYIFTDNTDRDSGKNPIIDGWYVEKYGGGKHYPNVTTAVIRELENARPISTQRFYHTGAKRSLGRWTDEYFDVFKQTIDDEFDEILNEWNTGKYKCIMFPDGDGIFNAKISQITEKRTPKIYEYLKYKVDWLTEHVNISYKNKNIKLF